VTGAVETGTGWELRPGRWQDVLSDVTACDALICDPPYSARTHEGRRTGSDVRQSSIPYAPLPAVDPGCLAMWAEERVREFAVIFCDHQSHALWASAFAGVGWYVFPPSYWHKTDAAPRMCGDGPGCSVEQICVARKRTRLRRMGHRPDHFDGPTASTRGLGDESIPGAKPVWLMQALVSAYSEPGDLVVDPYAGSGTTLVAAAQMGRRALGAEMDAGRFDLATRRLRRGYTPDFFSAA
jgi:hypothetical protein